MNVKDELLSMLLKEPEGISGSLLAERIGCSRMAISKSASALAEEGYAITVSRGGGYRLGRTDILSQPVLDHVFSMPVYFRTCCRSTMTEAKDLVNKGAEAPFAVVAARQEGGRGRLGRSFFSPEGGVYISIVLPGVSVPDPDLLTTSACLAVVRAIESLTGIGCAIKWVNDIYIDGRKAVGILTEGSSHWETGVLESAVVGIGINISTVEFPGELNQKAGSVFLAPGLRNKLAGRVLSHLFTLTQPVEPASLMEEYKRRCIVLGKMVRFQLQGQEHLAKAVDIYLTRIGKGEEVEDVAVMDNTQKEEFLRTQQNKL